MSAGTMPIQPRTTRPLVRISLITPRTRFTGNREADAFDAEILGQHRGVDADEFAIGIDQRAAGVADVDGRVGLDEVLEGRDA